ncbi:MAG: VOC family protein [Vicinamibacterales bacterium]|nr:VOC family protein [Vicinamibacterales bacterium]
MHLVRPRGRGSRTLLCFGFSRQRGDFPHTEAFSFQIATDTQEETDRYWNAIVGNGGRESECGWCKDRWGVNWQITPRTLTEALAAGGDQARRAFAAMMTMRKIDVAAIDAARRG